MTLKKKKEWISQETKLTIAELLLFFPAIMYWLSALIFVGMGTDYLFDVIIIPNNQYFLGRITILSCVILLPGLGAAGAWLMYNKYNNKMGIPLMITGAIMAIGGIASAFISLK